MDDDDVGKRKGRGREGEECKMGKEGDLKIYTHVI